MIDRVEVVGDPACLFVRARADHATCPQCGVLSTRIHGRYERTLVDAAIAGRRVGLRLAVRGFRCATRACEVVTFAEQVPRLTTPYARFTPLAGGMLTALGWALAGRAGARVAAVIGLPANRMTLLRRVRAIPETDQKAAPRVLGVDEFALRRGHR